MMEGQYLEHTAGERAGRRGGWRRRAAPLAIIALLPIVAATDCEHYEPEDDPSIVLRFITTTSGPEEDRDPDGYIASWRTLGVEDIIEDEHLAPNGAENIRMGYYPSNPWSYEVTLEGVAPNCSIAGGNRRTGTWSRSDGHIIAFVLEITCVSFGAVHVTNQTTGQDLDADGFIVTVEEVTGHLDVNGEVTLTVIPTGPTSVKLDGIATNCQVNGTNQLPVTVTRGATAQVAFDVTCQPIKVPVASVVVKPDSADVMAGTTASYTARTFDAGGGELTGRTITWSVADAGVATVDPMAGVVTGVAPGATTVTAMSEGITDAAIVVVVPGLGDNLLVDPSFEDTVRLGRPTAAGVWSGDVAAVVPAEQGITPFDGTSMLRFFASSAQGPGYESDSEMFQLVDVRAFRTAIDGGNVRAVARAQVNRIAGPQSDTRFELELRGFQGDCSTYPPSSYLLNVEAYTNADDDLNTWRPLVFVLDGVAVPPGTDCLVFTVVAREDRLNDLSGTEYVGQYADLAELRLRM